MQARERMMTELECRTSPLVNMVLALVLFLCFGGVVLFALMAGLADARNNGQPDGAFTTATLESYPPGRSDTEKWPSGPSGEHVLQT